MSLYSYRASIHDVSSSVVPAADHDAEAWVLTEEPGSGCWPRWQVFPNRGRPTSPGGGSCAPARRRRRGPSGRLPGQGKGEILPWRSDVARPCRPRASHRRGRGPTQGQPLRLAPRRRSLCGDRRRLRGPCASGQRYWPWISITACAVDSPGTPPFTRSQTASYLASHGPRHSRFRRGPGSTSIPIAVPRDRSERDAWPITLRAWSSFGASHAWHQPELIKLSPASDFAAHFRGPEHEVELISVSGECKEATVWFGAAVTCRRRATRLPGERHLDGPGWRYYGVSQGPCRPDLGLRLRSRSGPAPRRLARLLCRRPRSEPDRGGHRIPDRGPAGHYAVSCRRSRSRASIAWT